MRTADITRIYNTRSALVRPRSRERFGVCLRSSMKHWPTVERGVLNEGNVGTRVTSLNDKDLRDELRCARGNRTSCGAFVGDPARTTCQGRCSMKHVLGSWMDELGHERHRAVSCHLNSIQKLPVLRFLFPRGKLKRPSIRALLILAG